MKNTSQPDLRLILVARKGEEQEAAQAIQIWREAFSDVAPQGIGFCLWLTGDNPSHPDGIDACVHTLHLNRLIDGYQRKPHKRMTWSPWGHKSGPNYQFFAILDAMSKMHHESWVLQLELDTFPLRKPRERDLPWIFNTQEEKWIVGSRNTLELKRKLSESTRDHINGAAFYRIKSLKFRALWHLTWELSLLERLRSRPALAYDVITSPPVWADLPPRIRRNWPKWGPRLTKTGGMLVIPASKIRPALGPVAIHDEQPWFLHRLRD